MQTMIDPLGAAGGAQRVWGCNLVSGRETRLATAAGTQAIAPAHLNCEAGKAFLYRDSSDAAAGPDAGNRRTDTIASTQYSGHTL